jgi:membrane protease YdiL (CAAX protease family)
MEPVAAVTVTGVEEQGTGATRSMPNPFSTATTALYAAAWLLVMFQGWGAQIGADPTSWLQHPADTAARVVERDLELASAVERVEPGRELRRNLYGSFDEVLDASIWIQRDAADAVASRVETGQESPDTLLRTNAQLSVLLAEAGRLDEASEVAEHSRNSELEAANSALMISLESEERGARWLRRSDMMTAANMLLIAAGALVLIALARGTIRLQSPLPLVVPWSSALGFAVMVRADFWNRLYFVSLAQLGESPSFLYAWGTLIASLPMLWLVYRHLLTPSSGALLEPFGLSRQTLRLQRIVPIAGAVVAINFLGTTVLAWGSWGLGFEGHWAEGLDETLIWGHTREVIETSIDYVLLTPVLEELLFRGLLFFTLRNRFGMWNAALMSSLFFSAVHFYSLPGFLMTFWSGFVWAIAFERARSLLPGMAAHAIYNLFFVAGILLIYR